MSHKGAGVPRTIRIELEPKVWSLEHASSEVIAKWPLSLVTRANKKKSFCEYYESSSAEEPCRCLYAFNGLRPDFLYGPRFRPIMEKLVQ
jgi:hypothetical protein